MCRESGKTRFVREASALNLPEYQVVKDHLARVYTEAVFASQAGALQRPPLAETWADSGLSPRSSLAGAACRAGTFELAAQQGRHGVCRVCTVQHTSCSGAM